MKKEILFLLVRALFVIGRVAAEEPTSENIPLNSIEIFPVGEINIVQYSRMFSTVDELVLGMIWYDPQIMGVLKYPGSQRVLALETGYRRYLFWGLHLEAQLLSQLHIIDENGEIPPANYGVLAAELRLGYRWEFSFGGPVFFINPQFFSGYYLLDGRPSPFIQADKDRGLHPFYWSPIPMIFLGLRF